MTSNLPRRSPKLPPEAFDLGLDRPEYDLPEDMPEGLGETAEEHLAYLYEISRILRDRDPARHRPR